MSSNPYCAGRVSVAVIGPNTLIRTTDGSVLRAWDVSSRGLVGIHPVGDDYESAPEESGELAGERR